MVHKLEEGEGWMKSIHNGLLRPREFMVSVIGVSTNSFTAFHEYKIF